MTVEGVGVGDFQGSGQLGEVFLQKCRRGRDPATSDGVFAHAPDAPDVAAGDRVRIIGRGHSH